MSSFSFCGLELPGNVFLAPMAGVTNRPFRIISLAYGAGLAWTEMISAEGLVRGDRKTEAFLPRGGEGGAVAVQLFGHRPEVLRDAAVRVAEGPGVLVDINMGCPVRKIVKGGGGAALMRNPAKVARIIEAVCRAVEKPVTIKIRSGWNESELNAAEIVRIAAASGAAAVTIHGRTAAQGFSGRADWKIVEAVARESAIPIVGSGDLKTADDIDEALTGEGCAAVMIGRGALGRPSIFQEAEHARRGEQPRIFTAHQSGALMLRHLELNLEEFGARRGLILMRRPLAWYSRGMPEAAEFRKSVNGIDSIEGIRSEILRFCAAAELSAP